MLTQHLALNETSEPGPSDLPPMPIYSSEFTSPSATDHAMWSNLDLGEFMMGNDLDFLGRMFNFSHSHNSAVENV